MPPRVLDYATPAPRSPRGFSMDAAHWRRLALSALTLVPGPALRLMIQWNDNWTTIAVILLVLVGWVVVLLIHALGAFLGWRMFRHGLGSYHAGFRETLVLAACAAICLGNLLIAGWILLIFFDLSWFF